MTTANATVTPTVPAARQPQAAPLLLRPLRLQLRAATPPGQTKGLVDGAWWPYSGDLITELAPLLAGMAERGHLVHRISYSLSAWQTVPRKVHIAGTLVHACIRSSAVALRGMSGRSAATTFELVGEGPYFSRA
jgi:hypothetical protein